MAITKTYSAANITVWVGPTPIDDFEVVTVKKTNDTVTIKEGTGGRIVRTISGSTAGEISIKFNQASPEQSDMSGYATKVNGIVPFVPVLIKDNSGKSIHSMPEGTVVKIADATYGKESDDLEWMIIGSLPLHLNGGNN